MEGDKIMAAKLDKNLKELAQDLLKLQGVEYIDWLNKKHQEVITKNTKIIRNCVKNEIKNSNKKDEFVEEIQQDNTEKLESFEDENYNDDEIESERKELIYQVKDLNKYALEYRKVVRYALKEGLAIYNNNLSELYINHEIVKKLLQKDNFDSVNGKLSIWRSLKWIEVYSKNRFIKKVKVEKKVINVIAINVEIFNTLNLLLED